MENFHHWGGFDKVQAANTADIVTNAPMMTDKMPERKISNKQGNLAKVLDNSPEQNTVKVQDGSYADRVKNSRDPDVEYQLTFETSTEDIIRILPDEILDVGCTFGYALVGYFPTRHPEKVGLDRITKSWEVSIRVIPNVNGWTTFVFATKSDRDKVLCGGPYSIFGRTLLIKVLPKWFEFGEDEIKIIPIWTIFPNLPLECWNVKLLSRITSKVGFTTFDEQINKIYGKNFVRTGPNKGGCF